MNKSRSKATAATILMVAAVVAVCSAWTLASQPTRPSPASATAPSASPQSEAPDAGRPERRQAPVSPSQTSLEPKRLGIPAIGVNAPVVATGVTQNGDAEIPADGDIVGWYEFGSSPGEAKGSTVLIGHRDTNAEGPGALFDLDLVSVGDEITVSLRGRTVDYRVTAVRSVPKVGLPESLFRRGGAPQLAVITCGGAYIPDAGGYQENLFVVASPTR